MHIVFQVAYSWWVLSGVMRETLELLTRTVSQPRVAFFPYIWVAPLWLRKLLAWPPRQTTVVG
jgi:hypothetical protein